METITNELLEHARHLSLLIPDFDDWLASDERWLSDEVRLVDNVLFYVWHAVNEQCVDVATLPEELVAFYQKNERTWLEELVEI